MAEQLNHTEPLVPSHLERALWGSRVLECHCPLKGVTPAEYFTEQLR